MKEAMFGFQVKSPCLGEHLQEYGGGPLAHPVFSSEDAWIMVEQLTVSLIITQFLYTSLPRTFGHIFTGTQKF